MTQTTQGRPVRTVRVRGGKEYVEVSERVRIAHEEGGYTTLEPLVYNIGDRWFYRAGIIVDGETFYGTAEIKFGAPRGTADGDAPIECAETSAYGRAFAFAGIGILDGIASADEVRRVPQTTLGREQQAEPQATQARPASTPAPRPQPQQTAPAAKPSESGPATAETLNAIAKACELLGIAVPTNIKSEHDAQKRLDLYRAEWRKLHPASDEAKAS